MEKIITFTCSNEVHIYTENCGKIPMFPYTKHKSIESAVNSLLSRGIKEPKIKYV
jgi:hypothetical protein